MKSTGTNAAAGEVGLIGPRRSTLDLIEHESQLVLWLSGKLLAAAEQSSQRDKR